MLGNIIDRVKWEIRAGKSTHDAIASVADLFGLDMKGNIVNYLKRVFEVTV